MDRIGLLLDYASQGNVAGVEMLLDEGLHVDSFDYDRRTALHLAASEGRFEVVKLLLERNAHVNPVDRWRKTPLADARRYLNAKTGTKGGLYTKVCDLLMRHDGSTSSPFEIDLDEQQLKDAQIICKNEYGENKLASWRGTKVRAMIIHRRQQPPGSRKLSADSTLIKELSLLQRLRHPNIVQFLGAVTNFHNKAKPVVVVTEHLSNGNLYQLLMGKKGRRFQPKAAVNFALDIARGMNYLHQHRPLPIVHRELNPMNLYPDAAGRLKVAGLGLTTLMKCIYGYEGSDEKGQNQICMYARPECSDKMAKYKAPELENSPKTCHADKSVDVYSFGMILYEMFQGPSLASRRAHGVLAPYRPSGTDAFPLRMTLAPTSKLGELLKRCLARNAEERPSFKDLISALEHTQHFLRRKPWWVPRPMVYMGSTLVSTLSTHWYNCILNTKKAFNNSIVSVDESIRGGAGGRSRRGANVITNCHTIEEEAQEGDKEKRSCDCQLT